MERAEKVLNYYLICNKLKNVIRTGWTTWNVERDRIESVAEHVFGVQMLAIAMYSEYKYDIDILKVIYMLAIHELGEAIIGDLTQFQIDEKNKEKIEHQAVHQILRDLLEGDYIEKLFLEFDERKTKEAFFAFECDKLECDIQSKIYDEEGCVDLTHQEGNAVMHNAIVARLLNEGYNWSDMWLKFSQTVYPYDANFQDVSNYVINNGLKRTKGSVKSFMKNKSH